MKNYLLLLFLISAFFTTLVMASDSLDEFPSAVLVISPGDVEDTPVGQRVKAINIKMRAVAKEAEYLNKNSPEYLSLVEEHKNLELQQQEVGKTIRGLNGLNAVLYGTKAIQNQKTVKTEIIRVYSREYAPYRRGGGPSLLKNNTLYAYYEKDSGNIVVSHNKPDPAFLEKPQGSKLTSMATITKQNIRESATWKNRVGDLEERIERLAKNADQHTGTESYDLLMNGLADLKEKRDEHLKWFVGIEGINIILYGEEAIMDKPAFVEQAIFDLATSKGGASRAVNRTIYGWYDINDNQNIPWIDITPPQPKDIRPYDGDYPPGADSVPSDRKQGVSD